MQILYDGAVERKKEKNQNQLKQKQNKKTPKQTTQNPKTNKEKNKSKQNPPTYITAYVVKMDLTIMFGIKEDSFPV